MSANAQELADLKAKYNNFVEQFNDTLMAVVKQIIVDKSQPQSSASFAGLSFLISGKSRCPFICVSVWDFRPGDYGYHGDKVKNLVRENRAKIIGAATEVAQQTDSMVIKNTSPPIFGSTSDEFCWVFNLAEFKLGCPSDYIRCKSSGKSIRDALVTEANKKTNGYSATFRAATNDVNKSVAEITGQLTSLCDAVQRVIEIMEKMQESTVADDVKIIKKALTK